MMFLLVLGFIKYLWGLIGLLSNYHNRVGWEGRGEKAAAKGGKPGRAEGSILNVICKFWWQWHVNWHTRIQGKWCESTQEHERAGCQDQGCMCKWTRCHGQGRRNWLQPMQTSTGFDSGADHGPQKWLRKGCDLGGQTLRRRPDTMGDPEVWSPKIWHGDKCERAACPWHDAHWGMQWKREVGGEKPGKSTFCSNYRVEIGAVGIKNFGIFG